jgi:outer membrane protein assembly factor BamB
MLRVCFALVAVLLFLDAPFSSFAESKSDRSSVEPISGAPTDWPWWRGPHRNGIAAADQSPPLRWSDSQNVLWKSPLPGRGHGSVTVVGDQVVVATADEARQIQSVICFDRNSGRQVWKTDVHTGGFPKKSNKKASQASSTVACDGTRVFINFLNGGAVHTTALTRSGKILWQTKITDYVLHQGYGSSPALYESLVIVSADNKGGGAVAALNRATGDVVWKKQRPKVPNYASPIILNVAGRDQLLLTGCDLVSSFEPLTGKKNWEIAGATTECVTSTITDGGLIFSSGGYPKNHLAGIRADGSGEVVWENKDRVYVPSLLARDGHLYAVSDDGIALCWKSDSGRQVWKQRLGGGFTASPVMVGAHIFATNEDGRTFIFKADPNGFEEIARNDLGEEVFATPTICGSRIYMRIAEQIDGKRREMLYCLEKRR